MLSHVLMRDVGTAVGIKYSLKRPFGASVEGLEQILQQDVHPQWAAIHGAGRGHQHTPSPLFISLIRPSRMISSIPDDSPTGIWVGVCIASSWQCQVLCCQKVCILALHLM
jgi:hypothetical protein